jgi:F420-dependent oxidoreductase-like protein
MMSPREEMMKVSIGVGGAASGRKRDFDEQVEYVVEAERLGVDTVWTAEAWGQDAIAPLAFLAGRTQRIRLGTGIMQVTARTPVMTAMTALTMAAITGDRFILGLGNSGPQVVEGLHGVPFAGPLSRMREAVAIIRLALAGEKIEFHGEHYDLPRRGGQGKALRLAQPANPTLPIYLATLGPKALEFTGAAADGWVGTSFTPEHADAHLAHLRRGAQNAGRSLADLDIQVGGTVAFGEDMEALVAPLRAGMAFTLGAMGSPKTNFYNDAFRRGGWEAAAREVQSLWVAGRRDEAVAKVPAAMVIEANLLGTEQQVRDRIRAYRNAGVTTLRVAPAGSNNKERLTTLGRVMDIVSGLGAVPKSGQA